MSDQESDWGDATQRGEEEGFGVGVSEGPLAPGTAASISSGTAWAVVSADGTLIRGVGAIGASKLSFGSGLGRYRVSFWPDTTNAAYVATIGRSTSNESTLPGFITVNVLDSHSVFVVTRDQNSVYADRPFHLAVHLA
jgi:hypothetical protein